MQMLPLLPSEGRVHAFLRLHALKTSTEVVLQKLLGCDIAFAAADHGKWGLEEASKGTQQRDQPH